MKHMATRLIRKMWKTSSKQEGNRMGNRKRKVFKGSAKNFIENGAIALQESVSLFNGKTNPIRYFSVDELNTMNLVKLDTMKFEFAVKWYKGLWDGKQVMVKEHSDEFRRVTASTFREIIVSAQMSTHKNVHKLLGCCIETKFAVLVYEYVENVDLHDLIFLNKVSLDWKQRLKIAWEISHALAYLHTGFRRPIVHRNVSIYKVCVDKDGAARLSDFSQSISIPEGKEYAEDIKLDTTDLVAPEYSQFGRVSESADVYSFGIFFLHLLTGKHEFYSFEETVVFPQSVLVIGCVTNLRNWIVQHFENDSIAETIDPAITPDTWNNNEEAEQQLRASMGLALKCIAYEKDTRPTMVEVATELKSMIKASNYVSN